ncbi:hypothetical protein E4U55_004033 [Claviceps digitariae]|nr:hypothetical protein E4U55_004033 [Claviceps digitariae]
MYAEDDTAPLDDDLKETIELHGRLFQKYTVIRDIYYSPVDEREMKRLGLMHSILRLQLEDKLILAPVAQPRRILDCGFGAGDWAIDVANQFPESKVVGIDISPHMIPEDLPENLDLQIDDLNLRFTFPSAHFDLVHSQMMSGGIHKCQGHKDPRAALRLDHRMREAGFKDVRCDMTMLPMSPWPASGIPRRVGELNLEQIPQMLESMIAYPLTKLAEIPYSVVNNLCKDASEEARNLTYKAYFAL